MKLVQPVMAIIIFIIISLLFCYPQLSGSILFQNDTVQWQYNAHEGIAYHQQTGNDVMWLNNMYCGMPSFTTYVGLKNEGNYIGRVQQALQLAGKPAYFFLIYLVGFYLLLLAMGVDAWLAAVGALAYAFATFNVVIVAAGHETQALSLGYLPAALAGLVWLFNGRMLGGAALYGLALALMASNNHFQVLYYAAIIMVAFAISATVTAIQQGKLKSSVVAFLPSLPSFMATREFAAYTIRGGKSELAHHDQKSGGGLDKTAAFAWSSSIGETLVSLVPYLYGGSSYEPAENAPETVAITGNNTDAVPLYWGPQPLLQGPIYMGAVSIFLFVLGLMVLDNVKKWWMLAVSVLGFMMSWGSNFAAFNYWLFDNLPLLNMFRAVTMAKAMPQLLLPLMGILTVQQLLHPAIDKKAAWNKVMIAGGITAGTCLLLAAGAGAFYQMANGNSGNGMQPSILEALAHDRVHIARNSA
ncbi:MAG: hypothetical protein EBZ77_13795, partial [Chitinophagia bacterium]|nr:hypothetical protein [Chitinophagia bacterium]